MYKVDGPKVLSSNSGSRLQMSILDSQVSPPASHALRQRYVKMNCFGDSNRNSIRPLERLRIFTNRVHTYSWKLNLYVLSKGQSLKASRRAPCDDMYLYLVSAYVLRM